MFFLFTTCGILKTIECLYVILELLWFSHCILNTGIFFCLVELKNLSVAYLTAKKDLRFVYLMYVNTKLGSPSLQLASS